MDDHGSMAPQAMGMLLILAAVLMGVAGYLDVSFTAIRRSGDRETRNAQLYAAAMAVVAHVSEDPTPQSEWAGDPVHESSVDEPAGIQVNLTDISSRLNLNFVRKNIFEKTALHTVLKLGATATMLQQFRVDSGLSTSIEHYTAFVREAARSYCTTYGWANINLTDEFVLQSLYVSLTGSEYGSDAFHRKIQALLTEKQILDEQEFFSYFGEDAARIFPVINVEPWFNIHFIDPFILGELLAYPEYAIENPAQKTARLLELRRQKEMTREEIAAILGIPLRHILLQYIGTTTAFWEVTAQKQNEQCILIVARLPDDPSAFTGELHGKPRFRVIERRYVP